MNEPKEPRPGEAAEPTAEKTKPQARSVDDLPDGSGNDSAKHRHGDSDEERYDAG